jgi:hypothetical protein
MAEELDMLRRVFDADPVAPPLGLPESIKARLATAYDHPVLVSQNGISTRPRNRRRRSLRIAATALIPAALVVGGGNLAYAASSPGAIPAVPIAAPDSSQAGTFIPVATIRPTAPYATLLLASDPSGASFGCVSLTVTGTQRPTTLPDRPKDAAPLGTLCALNSPPLTDSAPGIGYEISINPDHPSLAGQHFIAFGFVPAGTTSVVIRVAKRGPGIFRLLRPTTTVRANVFGASLHLPIEAWEGPDLSGYSVKSIQAIDPSGIVIARLTF